MWRAAKSLLTLHAQLKSYAPTAPTVTWGLVGDAIHDPTSDHAPHDFPGWGNDIVTAADFPDGHGLDAWTVLDSIRRTRDPRAKYGISRGRIFSNHAVGTVPAWEWRRYTGSDPHDTHGHLSVVGDKRSDGEQPWTIGITPQGVLMALTDQEQRDMYEWLALLVGGATQPRPTDRFKFPPPFAGLHKVLAASAQREADLMATVTALTTGGTTVDTAAIVSVINARTADVTGLIKAQADEITRLRAELDQRNDAAAAAARAEADALTD